MDDNNVLNQNDVNQNDGAAFEAPESVKSADQNEAVEVNEAVTEENTNLGQEIQTPTVEEKDKVNEIVSRRINEVNERWERKLQDLESKYQQSLPAQALTPEEEEKRQAAQTFREIAKYAGFKTPEEIQQEQIIESGKQSFLSQVDNVNDKYSKMGLPKVDVQEIVEWAAGKGLNPDITQLPKDFAETLYRDRYFNEIVSYHTKNQNRPPATVKSGSISTGGQLSEEDKWNMPLEDLEKYISGKK